MIFRVWAPTAARVEVEVDGTAVDMAPQEEGGNDAGRGWWVADVADAGPGSRYWFSVDGGPFRPDPRSASQPEGVDGPSEVVDHGAFEWTDGAWFGFPLAGAVLHEIHIGTFSEAGTFDGAIEHLDHLADLGIDAVEVMPVAEFAGDRGWGYDGVDLFAPHHAYGGADGFKRFVDACHGHGLGVILDVVYNHLGPAGNHLATFGPYFTDHHQTNWGQGINVDGPHSDEVRAWIVANARHWLVDHHVDGLRLDAVHAIADDSAVHILEELAGAVRSWVRECGRPMWLIAESDRNDPRYVRPVEAGGYGLDSAWADEWHHALHAVLTGETSGYYEDFGSIDDLVAALHQAWVYTGRWSVHRKRTHGRSPEGLATEAFVISAQNHDQIGNRAVGDRLGHLAPDRLHIAAALLLTSPFVPMLFQGEEWGASTPFLYFTDHEPELGRAVTEGRRREFAHFDWDPEGIPDPQDLETLRRSVLRWDERTEPRHVELLEWHRTLLALRRRLPVRAGGRTPAELPVEVSAEGAVVTQRCGPATVVANLGDDLAPVPADGELVCAHRATEGTNGWSIEPDGVVVAERR
ncbi:MAG: malto-oligosyltrehalose trehalohydrolase [Acidimicrobiales bacterium]